MKTKLLLLFILFAGIGITASAQVKQTKKHPAYGHHLRQGKITKGEAIHLQRKKNHIRSIKDNVILRYIIAEQEDNILFRNIHNAPVFPGRFLFRPFTQSFPDNNRHFFCAINNGRRSHAANTTIHNQIN